MQKNIDRLLCKCSAGDDTCQFTGTLAELASHHNSHFLVKKIKKLKCSHCQDVFFSQETLDKHLNAEYGTCPKQPIDCFLKAIGCNAKGLNRENMSVHAIECSQLHLNLINE